MRKCLTCDNEYKYCPVCGEDERKPLWMDSYCCENCKDIFDIATEYFFGHINLAKAQSRLKGCDLSNLDTFRTCVKRDIQKILNEKEVENKEVKTSKLAK